MSRQAQKCRSCRVYVVKMGLSSICRFPAPAFLGISSIRNTLWECGHCKAKWLEIEMFTPGGKCLDWHYIPLNNEVQK
jgi:hypothetical protein